MNLLNISKVTVAVNSVLYACYFKRKVLKNAFDLKKIINNILIRIN